MAPGPTRAGWTDVVRLLVIGMLPSLVQGACLRRPLGVRLIAALDTHARGCRILDDLRERHGPGPVLVSVFGRKSLILLSADDVRRVLSETNVSFTTANREKAAALSHFEPGALLITPGALKTERRAFNEAAVERCAAGPWFHEACRAAVEEEIRPLVAGHTLTYDRFHAVYQRIVRRIVFGDAARDDERITELRDKLRSDGNWFALHRKRHRLRAELFVRCRRYVDLPEPGGLARAVRATPAGAEIDPVAQMQHWFFAFDAAPISDYLTLGLLACRPQQSARARTDRAYLRACVMEAQRLWPTTLALVRDSTVETQWPGGWTLPAGAAVISVSPFFHRDARHLPYADRFEPEVWLDGRADEEWSIAPFSHGPAECLGKEIVLSTSATLLTGLLGSDWRITSSHRLGPGRPLPRTADHTSLRFAAGRGAGPG